MSAKKWIVISGVSWMVIGVYLMVKGLNWITQAMMLQETPRVLKWFVGLGGSLQQGGLLLICLALLIGFIKGRMVLSKTVARVVSRLRASKGPIPFANAYDRKYYVVVGFMMLLGLLLRFLPIAFDVRGAIDVVIGSALMNGAMLYFREAVLPTQARN